VTPAPKLHGFFKSYILEASRLFFWAGELELNLFCFSFIFSHSTIVEDVLEVVNLTHLTKFVKTILTLAMAKRANF
jgi:hypothetical protein